MLIQSKTVSEEVDHLVSGEVNVWPDIQTASLTTVFIMCVSEARAVSTQPFLAQRSLSSPASSTVHHAGVPPRGLSKVSWKVYSDQYLEADYQAAFSDEEDVSSDSFNSGGEEEAKVAADDEESLADPLTTEPLSCSLPSSKDRYASFVVVVVFVHVFGGLVNVAYVYDF